MNAKTLTVTIMAPAGAVYAFASNPENLPQWAPGLALSVRKEGDDWMVTTSSGEVKIRFLPENRWGLLDHQVELPDGTLFNNPMRVVPNGKGAEVMFTLFQTPDMGDDRFMADSDLVAADLNRLKHIMENQTAS